MNTHTITEPSVNAISEFKEAAAIPSGNANPDSCNLELESTSPSQENFAINCYVLMAVGDPNFRLTAKSARKGGARADFIDTCLGWAFENREAAQNVADQFTQGKRKIEVVPWHSALVDKLWKGSKPEAVLARKQISQQIERDKHNKKKQNLEMECHKSGLHPSWLTCDRIPEEEDFSDKEKKTFEYYKPLWEEAKEEEEILELREHDLKCAQDDADDTKEEIPEWVQEFNKEYAIIRQGKTLILREGKDPVFERPTICLEPVSSFHAWHQTTRGDDGKRLSPQWIAHRDRREYPGGLVFDPRKKGDFGGCYNLFRGFPIEAKKGNCSLFWELVEALCDSNPIKITYIRRWLAHMIQRPWEIPETAIAMRGLQGIGKGRFAAVIEALVAPHYMEIAQMGQITGRFTSHLKDLLFVYADEAVWGGLKSEVGALKSLITQEIQTVEQKGIDPYTVRNCKRFLFSSNEDWIVPTDADERRFFIIDCGSRLKENHKFFKALRAQMEKGGGLAALMWELSNANIEGWHPRDMPNSGDGFDLKLLSLPTPLLWLYEALDKGTTTPQTPRDKSALWLNTDFEIAKNVIYERYKGFCEDSKESVAHTVPFWKKIRQVFECPESRSRKEEKRGRRVTLPGKEQARQHFERFTKSEEVIPWG